MSLRLAASTGATHTSRAIAAVKPVRSSGPFRLLSGAILVGRTRTVWLWPGDDRLPCPRRPWPRRRPPAAPRSYLLSGGQRQHHGYRDQALYLAEALENTGRYEVTIGEDAAILETPALHKYDLLIVNADRRDPEFKFTKAQQEALLDYVRSGHGYVSIHGADNAAADWLPEWKEMLGGVFSHVGLPDGKVRKGLTSSRSPTRPAPITQGLTDFQLKDELYYNLQMHADVSASGHDRIRRHRLARRLDAHLRQGPGLPHRPRPPRLRPRQGRPAPQPEPAEACHPGRRLGRGGKDHSRWRHRTLIS